MAGYTLTNTGRSIRCNKCMHVSNSARDVQMRYCPRCRVYHNDMISRTPYEPSAPSAPMDTTTFESFRSPDPAPDVCRADDYTSSSSSSDYSGCDFGSSSSDW